MVTGVIAEYNPFHKGHALQLAAAKQAGGGPVVAIMSGNFVQRGEPAILSKGCRARMALSCGADLVVELPLPWAMSTAQNFAEGGVGLLAALGCVEALSFGSECGDAGLLARAAAAIDHPDLKTDLDAGLAAGLPFAAAREQAVRRRFGPETAALLRRPNDTLAVEYLAAAARLGASFTLLPVRRAGAPHDAPLPGPFSVEQATASGKSKPSGTTGSPHRPPPAACSAPYDTDGFAGGQPSFDGAAAAQSEAGRQIAGSKSSLLPDGTDVPALSASGIRRLMREGKWQEAFSHLPDTAAPILQKELEQGGLVRPERLETALLARLRCMSPADFAALPDVSEGLENRLYAAARQAVSLEGFYEAVKVKRYSLARIRRIAFAALLGLDKSHFRQPVPYIRVLGFTAEGLALLRQAAKQAALPLLLRAKDAAGLDRQGCDVFQSECRADDLFWLAADRPRPCGTDFTDPVIRV